ncbi:hypothetical protein [Gracilibacillus sp. YIM 98692]|uniref:hypothetical protein n=1 Tax=Gracilibacillus sp. YIM 98692 TaxID=2663532 RepID=UPI0013D49777|nr:hypothetical protein [Gracilibacillus sp. YIM 98692]
MNDKFTKIILAGILLSLLIIAFKPSPTPNSTRPIIQNDYTTGEKVVNLGENKIAVVYTDKNSSIRGKILVLEFIEDDNTFKLISTDNYRDALRNYDSQ